MIEKFDQPEYHLLLCHEFEKYPAAKDITIPILSKLTNSPDQEIQSAAIDAIQALSNK